MANLFGELVKRAKLEKAQANLRSPAFIAQNNAIDDVAQLKAYNCTRRAGKSVTIAIDFTESAIAMPGTNYLYMALTIASAREILWDVLKNLNTDAATGAVANEARLELKFPNGSKIKFAGADCSEKQMRKVLGQKYKKIAIDEAGSFTIDMRRLVYQMCEPTLIDLRGQLILLGTCENIPLTFFEEVTEGKEPGWSIHKWSTLDNPFMKRQWEEQIATMVTRNPNVVHTSWYKTHYLNQWCSDDLLMIIKLDQDSTIESLPQRRDYEYILGVDLGYNDASAFSVIAYHDYDKVAYVVESSKKSELDFTGVFHEISKYTVKYPFNKIKIDGANKQGVEELRRRFGLPLEAADKTEKAIFLRLLRDDIIEGKVKVLEKTNNELLTEWKQLQWRNAQKEQEDPRCQNHISDATLYAWRESRHYSATNEPIKKSRDSQEYMDDEMDIEAEKLAKELEEKEFGYGY